MKKANLTFKPSNELIFQRTINLNGDTTTRSVLSIGLNPENKFKVYARLERESINDCFMFTVHEIENLLTFLHEERENIHIGKLIGSSNIGDRFVIYPNQSQYAEIYSYDDQRRFLLNIDSLKKLTRARGIIKRLIHSLQPQVLKCEKLFIWLLNNFCLGKTINEACESVCNSDSKWSFFENISTLKCVCSDAYFTSKIAIKCEYWFAVCVPWFLKTMMLAEVERLASFRINWPHFAHYVSIDEMARCGLYFTGVDDHVKCVFCNILLKNWKRGDTPIIEHFKYSSKCPFLMDYTKTSNISCVGDREKIDKLMLLLSKCHDYEIIDEVED